MKNKKFKIIRTVTLLFIGLLTFLFIYLTKTSTLFDFFDNDQKVYILLFNVFGVLLTIAGIYITVKTIKQFRTEEEIVNTSHSHLGIYNNVRNPVYSSFFLVSSGLLLLTGNFFSLLVIGINWLIFTLVIVFLEEAKILKKNDKDYQKYMLRVNRLIPWFNQFFKIQNFSSEDEIYLKQAKEFLNKEMIAPIMGIYFLTLPKIFWLRKGISFATEKGIVFYSYDVFRGHYGQIISYDKISSFVYGRGTLGYSIRIQASNSSINLHLIRKGNAEEFITYAKDKIDI